MPTSTYSTVFEAPADRVWSVIDDFTEDTWSGDVVESWGEEGARATEVGGVRSIRVGDVTLRQRLVAYSRVDRSYSYEFADSPSMPVEDFIATLSVASVTDGDRAFVEWSASYDCADGDRERCRTYFVEGCARWLAALRTRVE